MEKTKRRIVRTTDVDAIAGDAARNERKKEMDEDDKALLQPILPGMDDGQRITAPKRSNFQSNVVVNVASPTAGWIVGRETSPRRPGSILRMGGSTTTKSIRLSSSSPVMNRDAGNASSTARECFAMSPARTARKRFICDWEGCGKAFVDNSKLQRHRVTHTQEKNCFCDVCNASFGLKFNLHTHLKNVHGILQTPECTRESNIFIDITYLDIECGARTEPI